MTDVAGRATSFSYDANDRCISMTVPGGGAATYSYDSDGHLTQSVDLAGNTSTFTYNADHAMTSLSTGGKTTTFSYDESGGWKHVSSIVDALGHTTGYSANDSGLVTITEPGGGTMKYGSSDGKTTTVTNQLGVAVSTTAYNDDGLPSSVTFADGSKISYEYDSRGNVTRQTGPTGAVSQFTYDSDDNLTLMIDPMGKSWNYAYDSNGNLISETTPLGRATTYTRDAKGLITRTTLPDGAKTDFTYDAKGNMISETDPTGKATTYGYDAQGLEMTSITNPRAYTASFQYDANRRVTKTTFPDGNSISYGYDCCALSTVTDQAGNTTTTGRNALLWVTSETDAMGNTTTMTYDADGKGTSLTTPLQRTATLGYDAAHRLTSSTAPGGKTASYGYNDRNYLALVTDENGKATAMSYDAEGRLLSVTDPLNKTTRTLTRDALGRISTFTNARGQIVSYEYDDDGRVTQKKHEGSAVATYSYTTNGYLSSVNDSWGTTSMSYDAAGRVTQIDYPTGKSLGLAYDDGGNIASLSYPGGLTATYSYDNLNRLTRVDFGGEFISFAYDAVWNLTGETRSNDVTSTYTADANHRLTSLKSSKGTSTIISQTCTRDKDGRITSESGVRPLAPDLQATSVSATYNAANELITMGSSSYTYDDDGNLTAISGSRSFSATYDPENRPTSITLGGTARAYLYNGLGRRVRIQSGGNTRNLHHDHLGRLLFETNASGQLSAVYIYAGDLLVAQGDGSGNYLFPLRDKSGSTLALADESGTVVAAYAYGPYGAVAGKSGDVTTPFTYVGAFGVMDEGDDLYFMTNRYYDAVSGRFLQRDPIGFESKQTNLYAYVANNPINLIDPSGTMGPWGDMGPEERPPLSPKAQYQYTFTVSFMDNFCHQYVENLNNPNPYSPFYLTDKALTYVSPGYSLFSASLKFCAGEYWDGFVTALGAIGWKNAGRYISAWSDTTYFLSWLYFREPIDIPNVRYPNPSLTIDMGVFQMPYEKPMR
ncbi:MAG: RHS repeat protein [Desulfobacterales bacterium]|nr:RHS repeat protein [Desulfobacterales bacterium]MBL7172780.1 RHS repeat protein [Desulfobacteraceae bacterium]